MNGVVLEEVNSTHEFLKDKVLKGEISGLFYVFSSSQKAGIGRYGRTWSSPSQESFALSIALPSIFVPLPDIVTFFHAYCLQKILEEQEQITSQIKWPNDIYMGNWKLAGILTEKVGEFYLVGIGLNVNQKTFSEDLSNAVSLFQIDGKERSISDLLLRFLSLLQEELISWKKNPHYFWNFLVGRWLYQKQLVQIIDPIGNTEIEGIFEDVLLDGSLSLRQGENSLSIVRGTLRKK